MRDSGRGLLFLAAVMSLTFSLAHRVSPAQSNFDAEAREPQPAQPAGKRVEFGNRASELMGKKVYCVRGEKLGWVSDLVIDTYSGGLKYVIISGGGFAGIGSHRRAVPTGALSLATVWRDTACLNVTPERWRSAPKLGRHALATLGDPAQAQQIYQYYHQAWPPSAEPAANASSPESWRSERESAPKEINPGEKGSLQFASDLIGERVENRERRVIGRILDLLVELKSPNPTFAILKPASFLTKNEKLPADQLFLIPVNDIKSSDGHGRIALDVTPAQFQ
ncbi:MAG: antigen, partial [Pedosphaera sp.]|nr:antigen [Pedosphaera sp.]